MIKLKQINKVYNKNKSNENHVLKDISLELPKKGFVVLLGESGSGKSTLLNMMSGMDKPTVGTIHFKDIIFNKYNSKQWTDLRNYQIGYIYQNFLLKKDETVFDNIAFQIRLSTTLEKNELASRVTYLLNQVGLPEMEKRYATQLSGGQKQRVAIARALANNPDVILADEPTGNLDSKTSIDIMNIFKEIAKDKLVVLVTHEVSLAKFYADRIVEMQNGQIVKDEPNTYQGNLSVIQEHIIYLKDYDKAITSTNNTELITYEEKDAETLDEIGVTLIKRHNTLYVKVDSTTYKRIKYINDDSEIELKNMHFEDDVITPTSFDYNKLTVNPKRTHILSFKDSFHNVLSRLKDVKTGGKMLYVVLGIIGVLFAISFGLIGNIRTVDDSEFADFPKEYITVHGRDWTYTDVNDLSKVAGVSYVNLVTEPMVFNFETEPYYEIMTSIEVSAHPSLINAFDSDTLIYGEMPTNYGVIISQTLADEMIKEYGNRGIETYDDILLTSVKMQSSGQDFYKGDQRSFLFSVSGISSEPSRSIWMKEELIYSLAVPNLVDYRILGAGLEITSGRLPESYSEVTISEENTKIRQEVPSSIGMSSGRYSVVGTYAYRENNLEYNTNLLSLSHVDFIKIVFFYTTKNIYPNFTIFVYSDDIDETLETLETAGYNASYEYETKRETYTSYQQENNLALYITSIVGLVIGGISIFFIMRASLLSRIYDIALYRALGVHKSGIYKLFTIEIVLRATFSVLIGFLVTMILLLRAQSNVDQFVTFVRYPFGLTSMGILGMYGLLLFFGLLPIAFQLHKTPSELFKQYDL
ncbi:MAG: ATP-binding cassette domain-containing protein [Candidatus Izimaplasma sp.]|nr:ATP-binding cassette domain-containing protein [Candidatus Izimaplasma bacterium]